MIACRHCGEEIRDAQNGAWFHTETWSYYCRAKDLGYYPHTHINAKPVTEEDLPLHLLEEQ